MECSITFLLLGAMAIDTVRIDELMHGLRKSDLLNIGLSNGDVDEQGHRDELHGSEQTHWLRHIQSGERSG